jgi:ABC-type transport system involved in multi-copper enzyme maturation permease subunit
MLRPIATSELRHQLRQPLLWATSGVFFTLAFIATTTDAFQVGAGMGSLKRNGPYAVASLLGNLSVMGSFVAVAFVAATALRDFERRTDELVFSRPVQPRELLAGRLLGGLVAAFLAFASAALGSLLGGLMPWLDPELVGPFSFVPHLYGLGVIALPTLTVLGCFFFALATRVRSVFAVYVALVALLAAYFTAMVLLGDLENRTLAAFLDPYGMAAFDQATRYLTVAERNTSLPPLAGALLWNRLLWLGLGGLIVAWAIASFRYDRHAAKLRRAKAVAAAADAAAERARPAAARRGRPPAFTDATPRHQLAAAFRLEAHAILSSLPFLLILALGLVNVLSNMGQLDRMLGTPVWPVTHLMLLAVRAGYSFLLVVILTFYAGETVFRERGLRVDGVLDALPLPTLVPLLAKLLALFAVAAVFIVAGMVGLAGFQLAHGYTKLEPLLYLQGLVVELVPFLLTAALALFIQVVLDHKLAGYVVMILYLVSRGALSALHFDHNLYQYAGVPQAAYSDLNGWGHFTAPFFWFSLYWSLGAGVLLCLTYGAYVRGGDRSRAWRWAEARRRLRGTAGRLAAALALAFLFVGAFVFWNTNVRNEYVPSDEAVRRQAEYERLYVRYRDLPQPRITAVKTEVDIFPAERRARLGGTYRLVNRTAEPIASLHVNLPPRIVRHRYDLPPHRVRVDDRKLGHAIYELESPLLPGQEIVFGFEIEIRNPGFVNAGPDNSVVENGTLIQSRHFPSLGYVDHREIADPAERRRQGLPPARRKPSADDPKARLRNDLAPDADWLDFEARVSTSADQIAIAPGALQREWTEGGRRFFHYVMESPIPKFFAFLSGRYAVRRDKWKGVAIEVYHHPGHEYNLDRMIDATRKSLDYLTENFSPYQHRLVRIVEFPRYVRLAASFPTTIPFSESIGFIARLDGEDAIDYPFYVTAHEVAHQWWGYQVLGADVQGATLLSESMAQYSALMIMEREYGPEKMRRFLRYELDRYLSGRGAERVEEVPLERVEDQPYIHYSKGSLAFYALKDQIGEEALNATLKRYVASVRFAPPPYTISRDLLAFVAAATPKEKQGLLDDLFSTITLFDNQMVEATSRPLPDGKHQVRLVARTRKLRADGKGVESETPLDDWIDVGVFASSREADGPVLYFRKHHVSGRELRLDVTVERPPARAGIDPYNKLIDRTPGDNVRAVKQR